MLLRIPLALIPQRTIYNYACLFIHIIKEGLQYTTLYIGKYMIVIALESSSVKHQVLDLCSFTVCT